MLSAIRLKSTESTIGWQREWRLTTFLCPHLKKFAHQGVNSGRHHCDAPAPIHRSVADLLHDNGAKSQVTSVPSDPFACHQAPCCRGTAGKPRSSGVAQSSSTNATPVAHFLLTSYLALPLRERITDYCSFTILSFAGSNNYISFLSWARDMNFSLNFKNLARDIKHLKPSMADRQS